MDMTVWIFQGLMAFVFLVSGISKATMDEKTLVRTGQTGVEGLPAWLIRFIGVSEISGAVGLIVPMLFQKLTFLTPVAAICLGLIMVPAAVIHYRRREFKTVGLNLTILAICMGIAMYRWS